MYKDKEQMLREKLLTKMTPDYRLWNCLDESDEDEKDLISYVDCLNESEKEELAREFAEIGLEFAEDDIPLFMLMCDRIRKDTWPQNLLKEFYNIGINEYIPLDCADEVFRDLLSTLHPMEEQCILKLYKEGMCWSNVCDKLDIHVTELNKYIINGLSSLKFKILSKGFDMYIKEHIQPVKDSVDNKSARANSRINFKAGYIFAAKQKALMNKAIKNKKD